MSKIGNYLLTMQEEALYLNEAQWIKKYGVENMPVFERINGPSWTPYQAKIPNRTFWEGKKDD